MLKTKFWVPMLWFGAMFGTKDVCSAYFTAAFRTQMNTATHLSPPPLSMLPGKMESPRCQKFGLF